MVSPETLKYFAIHKPSNLEQQQLKYQKKYYFIDIIIDP
jgi:hypothetical protein